MLPRSFYFVRHGETDWNREGRIQGHTDIPLNETGRAQARNAVPLLKTLDIDHIVASPLSRAHDTAQIINASLRKPLLLDAGLKERHFGIFEGMETGAIDAFRADMQKQGVAPEENGYPCPPEGEPYGAFRDRTLSAFNRHLSAFEGKSILFVAHGGLYRVLRRCLFDCVDMSPNVQPYYFEKTGIKWTLRAISV